MKDRGLKRFIVNDQMDERCSIVPEMVGDVEEFIAVLED